MKIIDYQTLLADHKPQGHISAEANSIANALIRDNCIQAGNDLARFLEVDTCFNNHMALRVWVQNKLDNAPTKPVVAEEFRASLERELRDLFTNPGYGY